MYFFLLFRKGSFFTKASSEFLQLHAQLATFGTAYGLGDSEISAQGRLGGSTNSMGFSRDPAPDLGQEELGFQVVES